MATVEELANNDEHSTTNSDIASHQPSSFAERDVSTVAPQSRLAKQPKVSLPQLIGRGLSPSLQVEPCSPFPLQRVTNSSDFLRLLSPPFLERVDAFRAALKTNPPTNSSAHFSPKNPLLEEDKVNEDNLLPSADSANIADNGGPLRATVYNYRGHNVVGFSADGSDSQQQQMICLPQVYEIFLRDFAGGLHTVYTKLKRLGIPTHMCNINQIRALRSAGAIQPCVNRCKLIALDDFDRLLNDYTNSRSRPRRLSIKRSATHSFAPSSAPLVRFSQSASAENFHLFGKRPPSTAPAILNSASSIAAAFFAASSKDPLPDNPPPNEVLRFEDVKKSLSLLGTETQVAAGTEGEEEHFAAGPLLDRRKATLTGSLAFLDPLSVIAATTPRTAESVENDVQQLGKTPTFESMLRKHQFDKFLCQGKVVSSANLDPSFFPLSMMPTYQHLQLAAETETPSDGTKMQSLEDWKTVNKDYAKNRWKTQMPLEASSERVNFDEVIFKLSEYVRKNADYQNKTTQREKPPEMEPLSPKINILSTKKCDEIGTNATTTQTALGFPYSLFFLQPPSCAVSLKPSPFPSPLHIRDCWKTHTQCFKNTENILQQKSQTNLELLNKPTDQLIDASAAKENLEITLLEPTNSRKSRSEERSNNRSSLSMPTTETSDVSSSSRSPSSRSPNNNRFSNILKNARVSKVYSGKPATIADKVLTRSQESSSSLLATSSSQSADGVGMEAAEGCDFNKRTHIYKKRHRQSLPYRSSEKGGSKCSFGGGNTWSTTSSREDSSGKNDEDRVQHKQTGALGERWSRKRKGKPLLVRALTTRLEEMVNRADSTFSGHCKRLAALTVGFQSELHELRATQAELRYRYCAERRRSAFYATKYAELRNRFIKSQKMTGRKKLKKRPFQQKMLEMDGHHHRQSLS